jgi:D-alanyl-D-alanine carboxypeptidase
MLPRGYGARRGLRWGVFSLVTAISVLAVSSDPSDARSHRRTSSKPQQSEPAGDEPRYSDIVVDGNSGAVLHAAAADALRHPASLTKIMTLYLLFEQLEAGKLKLESALDVSEHAAGQNPTKLGLRNGQTIKVEDAIKGIVTRSANDAAVVVAEQLGGDEDAFARMMTRKAQSLGMVHTVYRNASGLPHDEQVTTARDQAILGRAIQERFPRYYKYFSTRSFEFRGESIGNHNHLLGNVEGVDGIKTGYISSSGYNLVTSVHRNNRYLVAVVFGGSSAGSRDERMRELIQQHIAEASTQRSTSMVAEAPSKPELRTEPKPEPKPELTAKPETKPAAAVYSVASASSVPITLTSKSDPKVTTTVQVPRFQAPAPATTQAAPSVGSADPIRPVVVKTVTLKPGSSAAQTTAVAPSPGVPARASEPRSVAPAVAEMPAPEPLPPPSEAKALPSAAPIVVAVVSSPASTPGAAAPPAAKGAAATSASQQHSGWIIQVGAFPAVDQARQRLSSVQSRASRFLASADAFTEPVAKGDATWYRARFAGLAKEQAEAACNYLKRNDVECMTVKN